MLILVLFLTTLRANLQPLSLVHQIVDFDHTSVCFLVGFRAGVSLLALLEEYLVNRVSGKGDLLSMFLYDRFFKAVILLFVEVYILITDTVRMEASVLVSMLVGS